MIFFIISTVQPEYSFFHLNRRWSRLSSAAAAIADPMAALRTAFNFRTSFNYRNTTNSIPIHTPMIKLKFCNSTAAQTLVHTINSANTVQRMSVSHALKRNREDFFDERNETAQDMFVRWFELIRDVFPGGRWWNLRAVESPIAAAPITVLRALREMWALVADDKWILYTAFGALIVAAVSECNHYTVSGCVS